MTANSSTDPAASLSQNQDCLQAELVTEESWAATEASHSPELPKTETGGTLPLQLVVLDRATDAEIPVTESFEFNYLAPPGAPPPSPEPTVLRRLLTPWSLGGALMFGMANILITFYFLTLETPTQEVTIQGFESLPPIIPTAPVVPSPNGASPLAVDRLSQLATSTLTAPHSNQLQPPQQQQSAIAVSPSQAQAPVPSLPAAAPQTTVNLASHLLPPTIRPNQAAAPSGTHHQVYSAPHSPSPNLPTVAVKPPAPSMPLPPPPPSQNYSTTPPPPAQTTQTTPSANSQIQPPAAPATQPPSPNSSKSPKALGNQAEAQRLAVENQMQQQLPPQPTTNQPNPAEGDSFNQRTRRQLTKQYNRSSGATTSPAAPQTQQMIQELESLNQAP